MADPTEDKTADGQGADWLQPLRRAFEPVSDLSSGTIWHLLSLGVLLWITWALQNWWFLLGGVGLLAGIALVTREVEVKADAVAVFRLGYGFVVLVLLGSFYLLVWHETPVVVPEERAMAPFEYLHPTIAVVPGCDFAYPDSKLRKSDDAPVLGEDEAYSRMPTGAHCGEIPPQWVLVIGGSVLQCHINGTCKVDRCEGGESDCVPRKVETREIDAMKRELEKLEAEQRDLRSKLGVAKKRVGQIELRRSAGAKELPAPADLRTVTGAPGMIEALEEPIRVAQEGIAQAEADREAAIEAEKIENNLPGSPIVGGVVVPMYFVIVAVLGALVGMMRKLPEYQARNNDEYDGDFEGAIASGSAPRAPIADSQVPDYVVFQMLQVSTATAVAILAYSWARPEQLASSVVLAFGAGFSSEVILMAVRQVIDQLIGLGPRGPRVSKIEKKMKADRKEFAKELSAFQPAGRLGGATVRVGDRVTLKQAVNRFLAGAEGVIVRVGTDGTLTVRFGSGAGSEEITKPADEFFAVVEQSPADLVSLQEGPVG